MTTPQHRRPNATEDPSVEPSAAPDAPAVGDDIAALADVPVGGSIDATINGEAALVSQPTAGQVVAFSAICTHQGCVVAAAGNGVPLPVPRLDLRRRDRRGDHRVPPSNPLPEIAVAVSGDRIVAAS